jgi:putative flippase GtrA
MLISSVQMKRFLLPLGFAIFGMLTAIGLLLLIVAICNFLEGTERLLALVAVAALLLFALYLHRWSTYPGLFQGKSVLRLTAEFVLAFVLSAGGIVIYFLVSRFHLHDLIKWRRIGERVGLLFKFRQGDTVRVISTAPAGHMPGVLGRIAAVRVISQHESSGLQLLPVGTVCYIVWFSEKVQMELPEDELIDVQVK